MEEKKIAKTSLGLEENVEAALCYVVGWVTGLIFWLLEKENKNIRFHAMQSIIVFLALSVIQFLFVAVLRIAMLAPLLMLAGIGLWVFLMVKAYQGERFKLPVVGDFAENAVYKGIGIALAHVPPASPQPAAKKIFCIQCGKEATTSDRFCQQCGTQLAAAAASVAAAPAAAPKASQGKEVLLQSIERELAQYPQLSVQRSSQTDLEIKSVLADANWGVGKKRVEYSACLLAKENEQIVFYWEMIKETGSGMEWTGGFKMQSFKVGKAISGKTKEVIIGPDGKKVADYDWDYGRTRGAVENVVKAQGWKFKTVLMKNKTKY